MPEKIKDDEVHFHKMMNILAEHCGFQLSEPVLALYDEALAGYGYPRVTQALKDLFREKRGGDKFPSVGDVIQAMGETVSDRAMAVNVTNYILWAFQHWKLNHCDDPDFEKWYRDGIGELPWLVVSRMGGYRSLYGEWNEIKDLSSFRAQIRDSAQALIELSRAGQLERRPALPGKPPNKQLKGRE